jgi:hypothetical protein
MVGRSGQEKAEAFVKNVKRLFSTESGLIYGVDVEIKKPKSISASNYGQRIVLMDITLYNVGTAKDCLDAKKWITIGDMTTDISFYAGYKENGYNPVIEIRKLF